MILGWSDQVFIVLAELIKANESTRRPCVAILAAPCTLIVTSSPSAGSRVERASRKFSQPDRKEGAGCAAASGAR